MMDTLLTIFAIAAGITSVLVLITTLLGLLRPVRMFFRRLFNEGTICLLRHEITNLYYNAKKIGYLHEFEKEDLIMMYKQYKKLGGNCYIDRIYDEMLKFPVD